MKTIAVFDIGKTNKKFLVFDQNYEVVFEHGEKFEEIEDEDGFPCDDIERFEKWIPETLNKFISTGSYNIQAINISAYGASLVHLNEYDQRATTLYNYLKPVPDKITNSFYGKYGFSALPLATESPILGMLNAGMQLYWLKNERNEVFKTVTSSLNFPEYCSFLLTGKKITQMTSLGSHTTLWDFTKAQYHDWLTQEGMLHLMPEMTSTDHVEHVMLGNQPLLVGPGMHDSSAALIPYLKILKKKFVLISSGTWNINMNPFNDEPLTEAQLAKDCLSYISYQGKKVKSSRVFLGNEYGFWAEKLEKHFQKPEGYHQQIKFDSQILGNLLAYQDSSKHYYPQSMKGTGPWPEDFSKHKIDLNQFETFEIAYHQLILDLSYLQKLSLELILVDETKDILVSGGFTSNEVFLFCLAGLLPDHTIFSAELARASSLGAAMVLHDHWNDKPIKEELLIFKEYKAPREMQIKDYRFEKP